MKKNNQNTMKNLFESGKRECYIIKQRKKAKEGNPPWKTGRSRNFK